MQHFPLAFRIESIPSLTPASFCIFWTVRTHIPSVTEDKGDSYNEKKNSRWTLSSLVVVHCTIWKLFGVENEIRELLENGFRQERKLDLDKKLEIDKNGN